MAEKTKSLAIHFPEGLVFVPNSTLVITSLRKGVVEAAVFGGITGIRYENVPIEVSVADMEVRDLKVE